jgi:hypothetical protein
MLTRSLMTGPKPVYPAALQEKKITGVAVAGVVVSPDGRMSTVVVLEAPDPLMRDAVKDALLQWTRKAGITDNRAWASKLIFYFQVRNGVGVVLNPDEMPGARTPPPPSNARAGGQQQTIVHHAPSGPSLGLVELQRQTSAGTAVLVDVRERDGFRVSHRAGAVNIPMDELDTRGPIELPAAKTIVVDCGQIDPEVCSITEHILEGKKFRVAVLKP